MKIKTETIQLSTKGHADIINITDDVQTKLSGAKLKDGIVTMSVYGSTAALTTCEYESGLIKDLKELFDKLIPAGGYHHDSTWGDANGHSHLRASLVGPSLTIPFSEGELILGTWQQIILIDFDNQSRKRKITLQFLGE